MHAELALDQPRPSGTQQTSIPPASTFALLGQRICAPNPTWETEINIELLPFLDHHRVNGAAVFPGAGYVDAMLAAHGCITRRPGTVMEGLEFRKMLRVSGQTMRIEVTGKGDLALYSRLADDAWALHAKACLSAAAPTMADEILDVSKILDLCNEAVDIDALYRQLAARGLHYGPCFQTIKRIWRNTTAVLAELAAHPSIGLAGENHQLHPTLLDGAFQSLAAIMPTQGAGGSYVPTRIERVLFKGSPTARLWSYARITKNSSQAIEADVTLCDDNGEVQVEIRGLRCQLLPARGVGDKSARGKNSQPTNDGRVPEAKSAMAAPTAPGQWLIVTPITGTSDVLAACLEAGGARCTRLYRGGTANATHGSEPVERSDRQATDAWFRDALLADALATIPYRGIVYLSHGMDEAAQAEPDDTGPLLHLVQLLAVVNNKPRLFIATHRAHGANFNQAQDCPVMPSQHPLWELGHVIAQEHPDLHCTLIDLSKDADATDLRKLAADLLAGTLQGAIVDHGAILHVQPGANAEITSPGIPADPVMLPTSHPLALQVSPQKSLRGLMFHETERRPPQPGQVELQITAASLNFKDVLKMSGRLSDVVTDDTFFGTDIGMEAAAVVTRVGDGVDALRPGDRIVAMAKGGCFRSYLTVSMDELYWLPDLAQHEQVELVGMPIVFATALYSLRDVARLRPGERVLLHSATGGVGLAAIQVARYLGAEILATAGSPEKRDHLRSLGIQHVMESRSLDFADQIMAATNGHGVDVVLNFLSGEALEKSLSVLAPFGRLVEIGKRDIEENSRLPLRAFNRGLSFTAVDLDRMAAARPGLLRALLREIWEGIRQGVFRPVPVQVFSAAEITRACRIMLKAEHIGKVVVQMADQMVLAIPMQPNMLLSDNATKPVLVSCDPLPP